MIIKFALIKTPPDNNCKYYVCGNCPQLGSWNAQKALELTEVNFKLKEPSFFVGTSPDIDHLALPIEYKYICQEMTTTAGFQWEGCGSSHNRKIENFQSEETVDNNIYFVKPGHWMAENGETNEVIHTTAFYHRICETEPNIHFSQIFDNLFLGSCPRKLAHISMLKNLGVTAVINLQTQQDIENNCSEILQHHQIMHKNAPPAPTQQLLLSNLYLQNSIAYLWLPTADMSTAARILSMPTGAILLNALLIAGHSIYIHCNAGVGRSAAIVYGYLKFYSNQLSSSIREIEYILLSKRPVIYFDDEAIKEAEKGFKLIFKNTETG